jgi:capsid protein
MAHAMLQDGEAFAVMQNNPELSVSRNANVQLDFLPIEADQVQTPYLPFQERGYIDGIRFDEFGNILWYDVLPSHPCSNNHGNWDPPVRVPPSQMLHWFKQERPDQHRGIPVGTSTLNTGAAGRRFREATLAAAETAADFTLMLESELSASEEPFVEPSILDIEKRMMTALPRGVKAHQLEAEHPNAQYEAFNRTVLSEEGRPFSMPYNLTACDSSNYSFASGKLDVLCFWSEMDVIRCDADEFVLDRLFASWWREWTILGSFRNVPPDHQWDWPPKPTIDAVAEATSNDMRLKNGTLTLRQAYSDQGMDFEDQLRVMAADYFGESEDMEASIAQMRLILLATHYPAAAAMLMSPADEEDSETEDQRYVS